MQPFGLSSKGQSAQETPTEDVSTKVVMRRQAFRQNVDTRVFYKLSFTL